MTRDSIHFCAQNVRQRRRIKSKSTTAPLLKNEVLKQCHLFLLLLLLLLLLATPMTGVDSFSLLHPPTSRNNDVARRGLWPRVLSKSSTTLLQSSSSSSSSNQKTKEMPHPNGKNAHRYKDNNERKNANAYSPQQQPPPFIRARTLSPRQIMYPPMASLFHDDDGVPFYQSFQRIQTALEAIASAQTSQELHSILGQEELVMEDSADSHSRPYSVLRIEQKISHSVDPLGWLHAQHKRQLPPATNNNVKEPFFYLQSTVETAVFGSAWTWQKPTKSNDDNASALFWDFMAHDLPLKSYLYGGERFDTTSMGTHDHDDWTEFGSSCWMLPAVELREEPTEHIHGLMNHQSNNTAVSSPPKATTLAVHLVVQHNHKQDNNNDSASTSNNNSWQEAARNTLQLLQRLSDAVTDAQVPATTLPPIIMRECTYNNDMDGQELYEKGVTAALKAFASPDNDLEKVVLARRMDLTFQDEGQLTALDILRKWKYCGIHEGGNMFYLRPPSSSSKEFFGCTPERLFTIQKQTTRTTDGNGNFNAPQQEQQRHVVLSEALAGTRPRGTSQAADEELLRDLFGSVKDREENTITAKFIQSVFAELGERGLIEQSDHQSLPSSSRFAIWGDDSSDNVNTGKSTGGATTNQTVSKHKIWDSSTSTSSGYFVRRLRHLQHICQRYAATLSPSSNHRDTSTTIIEVIRHLLANLHPTPAVNGFPAEAAKEFIRQQETIGFDRGFYAGPVGYMGRDAADILVAIRSGLVSQQQSPNSNDAYNSDDATANVNSAPKTTVSVYAGAGLVPGSTVQGEWAETSYKLGVISSLFPQSPMTLQSAPTPNVAWANAFVEELIRNGVTQFYVCPGSRSTPLVVAIAKAARSNVGVVHAVSVHDERGAGFRAVGFGRGANRPAAIVTSSGTAVANLYPAIIEAAMDGVPMLILTADRPYENRDTGENQAIDQVKAFSSSYIRWFRDILPPHDDVPVSVALADAGHAVTTARNERGPVHLNIQFRENLAPEAGPIRNDHRVDSNGNFNGFRFTDVPGFSRWSTSGNRWQKSYTITSGSSENNLHHGAVTDIARLIMESKRGIIVVGNIRTPTNEDDMEALATTCDVISKFAESIGFPMIAGAQSGPLRFSSSAVIPFAEHILRNPKVAENIKPDLILQIGTSLVSTEVPNIISKAIKGSDKPAYHVLLHPHQGAERADPSFTVSHRISAEISPFLKALSSHLDTHDLCQRGCSSQLAPLVLLGRQLQKEMPRIINKASEAVSRPGMENPLIEPQVVLGLSMMLSNSLLDQSLFLSNSMPVRDAEFFLYPTRVDGESQTQRGSLRIGSNRGASGIDGIISSATGFAESTGVATTLLIGDLAALHDINSFHALSSSTASSKHPLTTLLVNNDGGGIFSFLPIAKHGNDVSFDEFFGTPTNTFSYKKGVEAFGLPVRQASTFDEFCKAYAESVRGGRSSLVEAQVVGREDNVVVHKSIAQNINTFIDSVLEGDRTQGASDRLSVKFYSEELGQDIPEELDQQELKTLVLLHGWMGDKTEWDEVGSTLAKSLPSDWFVVSIDLPGHGASQLLKSSDRQSIKSALGLNSGASEGKASIDDMAQSVLLSLSRDYGVTKVDALAGYSLGGRVALAMKRISSLPSDTVMKASVEDNAKLVLLSSNPGNLPMIEDSFVSDLSTDDRLRMAKDDRLSREIEAISNRATLMASSPTHDSGLWSDFLLRWYRMPMWGELKTHEADFSKMVAKRNRSLLYRGRDLAAVLQQCSPSRNSKEDWRGVNPKNTLFLAGSLDSKYAELGRQWSLQGVTYTEIPNMGHALLIEAGDTVSDSMSKFIMSDDIDSSSQKVVKEARSRAGIDDVDGELQQTGSLDSPGNLSEPRSDRNNQDWVGGNMDFETAGRIDSLDFDPFTVDIIDESRQRKGVFGIGWGEKANKSNQMTQRDGFVVQLLCSRGSKVGVGEVSPLPGLHKESLAEVEKQLIALKNYLDASSGAGLEFEATSILALDGGLRVYLEALAEDVGAGTFLPSVRSGLEMAMLSLAAQIVGQPLHKALANFAPSYSETSRLDALLPVNGLVTRGSGYSGKTPNEDGIRRSFPSLKVKVGHQDATEDATAVSQALQRSELYRGPKSSAIRADANRAWDDADAFQFATALGGIDIRALERLEFVEEPLQKQVQGSSWSLEDQIHALERWHKHTGIPYALDETLADIAKLRGYDFMSIRRELKASFGRNPRGCAALVLKPALIGLELSIQLARMARTELGIGAAFSSSFDSGVALAYTAILGALSDATSQTKAYSHGVGTFTMLDGDTLSPTFASYVNENGFLNVPSLSRAFNGLGLDELRDSNVFAEIPSDSPPLPSLSAFMDTQVEVPVQDENNYEASTATSKSGREINLVVSLPLPFSGDTAFTRFTDFPQQSRWSPWIRSVRYLDDGRETEWTLNVRGVQFRWRAISSLLEPPLKGIQWESVSGLKNRGIVEFVETGEDASLMKVRMSIVTPRILASIFQSTSLFVEDFLRNKLLKWSLEMFRDVVKGDLALERGDVELGDALFGSVEGKASAIEATLSLGPPRQDRQGDDPDDINNDGR